VALATIYPEPEELVVTIRNGDQIDRQPERSSR
jgi:hypothetical protein